MDKLTGNRRTSANLIVAFACLALSLVATAAAARAEQPPTEDLGSCRFHLPRQVTTIVYESYGGGLRSKYRLADQPNTYLGRQEIRIPKRDNPLFVVLTSSGPTEWDMTIEPGAEIAGFLVLGYSGQIVSRVPPATPIGFSTYTDGPGSECPTSVDWDSDDLQSKIRKMLDLEFSLRMDEYYRRSSGKCDYVGCGGDSSYDGKQTWGEAEERPISIWGRLFGSTAATPASGKAPTGNVRTSARLIIRSL